MTTIVDHHGEPVNDVSNLPSFKQWLIPLTLSLISILASGWNAYTNTDKAMSTRISVLEANQNSDNGRLGRIELKLDRLEDKMDRLIERKP